MSVSVIIPSYNRADMLVRALHSVYSQSRPANEVIVVDDGSDDATAAIVRREFPDVRLLQQQNRGVSAARNLGIRNAQENWIAFLDSDDCWHHDKLERQLAALERQPDLLFAHCDEIWVRNGKRVNPVQRYKKYGGDIFRYCLAGCIITPSSVIVHQDLLQQTGLFDESLPACEDYDLWLRICSRFPVLYQPEQLLTRYAGHPDQLSQQHWGMDRFRVQALEKILTTTDLDAAGRQATADEALKKLDILINGARKRHKDRAVSDYIATRDRIHALMNQYADA